MSGGKYNDTGLIFVYLKRTVGAGSHGNYGTFSQFVVTALNSSRHIDKSLGILYSFQIMGKVLRKVVEDNFSFMKRSYFLIHISCSYSYGEYVDGIKCVTETSYIPQIFLCGLPDLTCVGSIIRTPVPKFLKATFCPDQRIMLWVSATKNELFRTDSMLSLTRFLGKRTLWFPCLRHNLLHCRFPGLHHHESEDRSPP